MISTKGTYERFDELPLMDIKADQAGDAGSDEECFMVSNDRTAQQSQEEPPNFDHVSIFTEPVLCFNCMIEIIKVFSKDCFVFVKEHAQVIGFSLLTVLLFLTMPGPHVYVSSSFKC
jgi:hypothetical protein